MPEFFHSCRWKILSPKNTHFGPKMAGNPPFSQKWLKIHGSRLQNVKKQIVLPLKWHITVLFRVIFAPKYFFSHFSLLIDDLDLWNAFCEVSSSGSFLFTLQRQKKVCTSGDEAIMKIYKLFSGILFNFTLFVVSPKLQRIWNSGPGNNQRYKTQFVQGSLVCLPGNWNWYLCILSYFVW